MSAAKAEEARQLMKSAKKHATKSITKWSVDYDLAANDYEKAAKLYTHAKMVAEAKEAWTEASEAHTKAKNPFFAAKCVESLASMLKEDEAFIKTEAGAKEVSDLYIKLSNMYALDGKPERQADALQQAARVTPPSQAATAADAITRAIDALEESDKHHYTPDAYRALLLIQLRGEGMVPAAIETLRRQMRSAEQLNQPSTAAKAALEIIVLSLSLGDFVLADREFRGLQNAFGFAHSREQSAAFELISAFEERDEEQLKEVQKSQIFSFLIPDVARLVKRLKLNGVANIPPRADNGGKVVTGAPAVANNNNNVDEVAEEDEDDLR